MRNNNTPFALVFGFFSIHFEENQKQDFRVNLSVVCQGKYEPPVSL